MLQAALDHEESLFDTPKAWNPYFQWVFNVLNFEIQYFQKEKKCCPMLKYVSFHAEFESAVRFA